MSASTELDRRPAAGSWPVWKRVMGSLGLTILLLMVGAGLILLSVLQDVLSDPFGWAFRWLFGSGDGVRPEAAAGQVWLPWALLLAVLFWLGSLWVVWRKPVRRMVLTLKSRRRGV